MGRLEKEVRAEMRKTKVNNAIVGAIALGGLLAVSALASNVLGVLGKMKFSRQRRYQVKRSFSKMLDAGYIVLEKKNGVSYAKLTAKGERFAALMNEGNIRSKKQKRWDGKWRVLIFDITEKRKNLRDKLRFTLSGIGFVRLQDSVWVYPYDCEDFIAILKIDLKMGKEVIYIIADRIENDGAVRRQFGLSVSR